MGSIKAIAFDKTGTLTQGRPVVTDIVVTDGWSEPGLLGMAAGIEKWSEHPWLVLSSQGPKDLNSNPRRISRPWLDVGRRRRSMVKRYTSAISDCLKTSVYDLAPYGHILADLEQQGKTVMLLGTQHRILGMIAVADTLREDSREAIKALHGVGIRHIAMLTGDNNRVASAIARKLDLDSFYSELLPEDKVAAVKKIARDFGKLVMVGDGVNDAPALAVATVGVAMGTAGSDVALETADVALMTDDLGKLAYIVKLSHKTVAIIKENIAFSISIKIIFLVLLSLGLGNLWLAVFADMGASLLVTLNGMRLMRRLQRI